MPCLQPSQTPLRFTSITRSHVGLRRLGRAAVVGREDPGVVVEHVQAAERLDREAGPSPRPRPPSATSTWTNAASPPAAGDRPRPSARPLSVERVGHDDAGALAPRTARAARPMPFPAPVISATLPASLVMPACSRGNRRDRHLRARLCRRVGGGPPVSAPRAGSGRGVASRGWPLRSSAMRESSTLFRRAISAAVVLAAAAAGLTAAAAATIGAPPAPAPAGLTPAAGPAVLALAWRNCGNASARR